TLAPILATCALLSAWILLRSGAIMPIAEGAQWIGAALRARRKDLDLTQAEAAARADVSVRFICDLESGKESVHLGLVLRVVDALCLRMVLDGCDDMPPSNAAQPRPRS